MDDNTVNKLARILAAYARVEAMKVEVAVAVALGNNPPDYSPDIRSEADYMEEIARNY